MVQPHYPVLVYGATFAGIGMAAAAAGQALLVERSALVGHDFIASYNPGTGYDSPLATSAAEELRTELLARNLLTSEGRVHLPAMSPVLFNRMKQNRLPVRMLTELVSVSRTAEGFEVTLFSASGLEKVHVNRIIDTTATCRSKPGHPIAYTSKSINAYLHCPEGAANPIPAADDQACYVEGLFPGELILKLKLEPGDDWTTARSKLHSYWKQRHVNCAPWTVAALADTFEVASAEQELELDAGWSWFPSSNQPNPLQAYEAGYLKGCRLNETIPSI
jgi:hypothetical protein